MGRLLRINLFLRAIQRKQTEQSCNGRAVCARRLLPCAYENFKKELSESEVSRVVEMAWEDRTPFEVIEATFGLSEPETIKLMRRTMKPSSFRLWRKRVTGRVTKHRKLRGFDVGRGYCPTQYKR